MQKTHWYIPLNYGYINILCWIGSDHVSSCAVLDKVMNLQRLVCGFSGAPVRVKEELVAAFRISLWLLYLSAPQQWDTRTVCHLYASNVAAYLLCVVCEYNLYFIYSTFHESVVPHLTTMESEFWIFALQSFFGLFPQFCCVRIFLNEVISVATPQHQLGWPAPFRRPRWCAQCGPSAAPVYM